MADVKISGLPASTVPLAGTEVLPIVQGGATKQVSIANVTAGRVIAASGITTDTYKAASSAGGTLQANNGTDCLQWGAGGGSGLIFDGGVSSTAANAALVFSPTGTGTVAISPAGALTINPTAVSTINNVSIGVTTPLAGGFTTVKAATTIGVGAATPAASGAGITFPATQSASSDANTLDDYETGDWTPVVTSQVGTITTATATGRYIKIGKLVYLSYRVTLTSVGTASGQMFASSLPYASNASATSAYGLGSEVTVAGVSYQNYLNGNSSNTGCSNFIGTGITWVSGYIYDFSLTYST